MVAELPGGSNGVACSSVSNKGSHHADVLAKLQNERQGFLDAFEKPTLIYWYFSRRSLYSPVFLPRTLSYMKNRKRRKPLFPKGNVTLDKILAYKHQSDYPFKKFYISLFGFSDPNHWKRDTKALVDICIARINKAGKSTGKPRVLKTFEAKVEVNVFSSGTEIPQHGVHTSIFIPGDCFCMKDIHAFESFRIMFRVVLNNHSLANGNGIPEPPPSFSISSFLADMDKTSKDDEASAETLYYGMLTLTKDNVLEGFNDTEYEIILKEPKSETTTLHCGLDSTDGLFTLDPNCAKLAFTLRSQSNKKIDEFSSMDIDGENTKLHSVGKMEEDYKPVHYLFTHCGVVHQETLSVDYKCPWCSINCLILYSLLKHLRSCHFRFRFVYVPLPSADRIEVTINDAFDGSYSGSPYDLVVQPPGSAFGRTGPKKRTPVSSILVCRPKHNHSWNLDDFIECDQKDKEIHRVYTTGHNRLYHHTSTSLPLRPAEMEFDSENEPDPDWLRERTSMMIDEFTDVNEGEKELMKLWNIHMMRFNFVGDCQIPAACLSFVKLHGEEVVKSNLYRNFILHLTNLFEFGLLSPEDLHTTVEHLQIIINNHSLHEFLRDGWQQAAIQGK